MLNKVRWQLAGLLFIAGIINYLDRAALSVAAPLLSKELDLNPAQLGIVFSTFFFGYMFFCFIGGYAADKFGPRRVLIVAMLAWSFFCGATALAFSLASLLVIRLFFGMAEGPFATTMAKFIGNWFPRSEQAGAVGVANAGTALGGAAAGPVVGFLALQFGWRMAFVAIAAIGLVWLVFWARKSTDRPELHPRVSPAEQAEIAADRAPPDAPPKESLGHYLRSPAVLSTALAFFSYAYILYFFLSWFPTYLTMEQHLSIQKMAVVSAIPWALGFAGLACGGFVCDALGKRLGDQLRARKIVMVTALLVAALSVGLAGVAQGLVEAVGLMSVATFFLYVSGVTYWSVILGVVEQARVGGVAGFVHLIANAAGVVAPALTGFLIQHGGGFKSSFALAGGLGVAGAALVFVFVRGEPQTALSPTRA